MTRFLSRSWCNCIAYFFFQIFASSPLLAGPLTLDTALATVESAHPDLLLAKAERDSAIADVDIADSRQDTSINLEGILRSGRPTFGENDFASDNSVRLTARKTLYDFGRSSNTKLAAKFELNAREADLTTMLDKRRLIIMTRYFDVLLADMENTLDRELTSVHYTNFVHGKDRMALGRISSVELAELESIYRDTVEKRNASAQRQRITRAMLANAMNRPSELPDNLEDPRLPDNQRSLPAYENLLPVMLNNNSRLLAQQDLLAASQKRIESVRAENGPILDIEVQAADYSRTAATRDNLSAGLFLVWPLYQGNRLGSRLAREIAQFNILRASADKLRMELTQALLETYLDITRLQSTAREAALKNTEYRDLQLERSRGLYELELKSNLGTSMVETSDAKLRERRNEYLLALSIASLEALIGRPLSQVVDNQRK